MRSELTVRLPARFNYRLFQGLDPFDDRLTELFLRESLGQVSKDLWVQILRLVKIIDNNEKLSSIQMLFTVVINREEKYYVALAPDVDVVSQGETIEEALANLKEALELYLEDDDAIRPPLTDRPFITMIETAP